MLRDLQALLFPATIPARKRTREPAGAGTQRDTLALRLRDGREVAVLRVRDPRARRIKLSVSERGLRLTLPTRASLVSGERFLAEHLDWIAAQLARLDDDAGEPLQRERTGELPLRGERVPLRWTRGALTRVRRDDDGLQFEFTARAGDAALRRALRDFYEAQARADIGRWLPRYLPALPRAPRRVQLKILSSQWGSLAPDGTLSLDLSLVLAPPDVFEYVLVHELCHLILHNHSAAFWSEVEARFPHWRTQRDWFREHGRALKHHLRRLLVE